MFTSVVVHHILRARFYFSMTLGIVVYFYNPQIEVCLLCAGVILGTTIGIAVCCISRLLFLPGTTLGMPFVSTTLRLEFINYISGL